MTPRDLPPAAGQRDAVVLAWEWSGNEDDSTRLAAFNMLAALARQIDAALLLPIDAGSERLSRQIVDTLVRHGVAALPVVAIDAPAFDGRSPAAAASPGAMLATLASACALVEWDDGR